jgi:hypothetical protein
MKEGLGNIGKGIENVIEGVLAPISWIWEDEALKDTPTLWDKTLGGGLEGMQKRGQKTIDNANQDFIDLITGKATPIQPFNMYNLSGNTPVPAGGNAYTPPGGTPSPMPSGAYEKPLNYFNINPSEKMNEVELAEIISRKVAWNMRRGGVE